jgi:transcriptional regulator with XRE-family HTH domain
MESSPQFDIKKLAALVQTKRGERGLRETAKDIGGVSASTLSRIEQGNVPDLETFMRLTSWLGVSADDFLIGQARLRQKTGGELCEAHLRADRTLPPEAIDALAQMIRFAYKAAKDRKR